MTEISVRRRSSDGARAVYCVGVRNGADRTIHDVAFGYSDVREFKEFASVDELLTFVFEWLLLRRDKDDIPSSFALKNLLNHESALVDELREVTTVTDQAAEQAPTDENLRDYLSGAQAI